MPMATGRDRVLAAFSPEGTDDFPVLLPYVGLFMRDHWAEVTDAPWWIAQAGDSDTRLKVARDLANAVPIDWVAAERCPPRRWRERHRVARDGEQVYLEDRETRGRRLLRPEPPGGTQVLARQVLVRTPADVEALPPIRSCEQILADGCLDYARQVVETLGRERFTFASAAAPFWLANGYLTFEGLMTAVVENAEVLTLLLKRLAEEQVESVRAAAAAGVDGIWVEDCYSSADLISPAQFRRFALPYVERVIAEAGRLGLRTVYYFCGDVSGRLEELIATRPTALSLEESKKGFRIELREVAEVVRGRCALLGNLDAIRVLEQGDSKTLRNVLASQGAVGRRWRRFAFSLGSPVTPGTPVERVREYVSLARPASAATVNRAGEGSRRA